jgi:hypothetical protein
MIESLPSVPSKGALPCRSGDAPEQDRVTRIKRILAIVETLSGKTEAVEAIVEDERANLKSFLIEDHKSGIESQVKTLLGK